jgi:hypothetical protein
MPTGSLYYNTIVGSTDGGLYFVPSGSTTVGVSQSAAIAQVAAISMSANTNNLHTPTAGTSSYFTISSSNQTGISDQSHVIYYTNTGSTHITRIVTAPNSSSAGSDYGSLGGQSFAYTASNGSYRVWYANPESKTNTTSSVITISSFSGSQSTSNQYTFYLSGSSGTVFTFIPTGSINTSDYIPTLNSHPFTFLYSGSSGPTDNSSSISEGVENLVEKINSGSSTFGVTATASAATIQFTATQSGALTSTFAFITQSLTNHSNLKTFTLAGGKHITSSAPSLGGADYSIKVPLQFTASAYNVATASATALNNNITSSVTATVSGSDDATLYGLIIETEVPVSVNPTTGSTTPQFTYVGLQTGSSVPVPPEYNNSITTNFISVNVSNNASLPTMISESIYAINSYAGNGAGNPFTASFSSSLNPSFTITNLHGGAVNAPDSTNARTITASIVTSGSGNFGVGELIGTPDTGSASSFLAIDPVDPTSFVMSGSGTTKLYFSGSGKIGLGTTNPERDFDIRSDDFGIRKKTVMAGIRMNSDGNFESFNNDTNAAATGSELIMKYSRGSTNSDEDDSDTDFSDADEVQANDVLGSIRWVVDSGSIDERSGGEAARIQTVAANTQAAGGGIIGEMHLQLAADAASAPSTILKLSRANNVSNFIGNISGSGNLKIDGSQVDFTNLPTSDPSVAGRLWNEGGSVMISAG